jgi:prephenate dehydratase
VTITVAYQGEAGAFSEMAIVAVWGTSAIPLPCEEFSDVVAAVEDGRADAGMLPTANVIAGPVAESIAAIEASTLSIVHTTAVPIRLSLLALPGATLESLRSVESHPMALLQCGKFLRAHPQLVPRTSYDTAGAARAVAASADMTRAAIASSHAGALNGLVTLAFSIEDRVDNVTQFAIVARDTSHSLLSALADQTPSANLER